MTNGSLSSGLFWETSEQARNRRFGIGENLLSVFEPLPDRGEFDPQRLFLADACWQLTDEDAGGTPDLNKSLSFEQSHGRLDGAGSHAVFRGEFPVGAKSPCHPSFFDLRSEQRCDPSARVPFIFSVRHEIQPTHLSETSP